MMESCWPEWIQHPRMRIGEPRGERYFVAYIAAPAIQGHMFDIGFWRQLSYFIFIYLFVMYKTQIWVWRTYKYINFKLIKQVSI